MPLIVGPGVYHTNGTATISVNGTPMGVSSAEGVKVTLNHYTNEIYTDERGPNVPAQVLSNGGDARIEFELWKYNTGVLTQYLADRINASAAGPGTVQNVGALMFDNYTAVLSIASPVDGVVWTFNRTWVLEEASAQLSTQLKIWSLVVRAVCDVNGSIYTNAFV